MTTDDRREPTAAIDGMDLRVQRSHLDALRRTWKHEREVDPDEALGDGSGTVGAFALAFVKGTIAKRRAKRARQKDARDAKKEAVHS